MNTIKIQFQGKEYEVLENCIPMNCFQELTTAGINGFKRWAKANMHMDIQAHWHPVVQDEMLRILRTRSKV